MPTMPSSAALFAAALGLVPLVYSQTASTTHYPDCVNGPLVNNLVCDPSAPERARAAALVEAMNITERLAQLVEYVEYLGSLSYCH